MSNLFKEKIKPENVLEIAKFDLSNTENSNLDKVQSEGVAGIYNILTTNKFAFLADEVGLGKTYQALALITLIWNLKPDARILVICPKENLQGKWINDYNQFIKNHYIHKDDIVKTSVLEEPVFNPVKIDRLNDFAKRIRYISKDLFFLRHTSFTRPMYIDDKNNNISSAIKKTNLAGLKIVNNSANNDELYLQYQYANALNELLRTIGKDGYSIDLVIFDESQYLRNPDNQTNSIFKQVFFPEKDFENQFKEFNSDFINKNNGGIVNKWLFMSATPIHSSKMNVFKTLSIIGEEENKLVELKNNNDEYNEKYKNFLKSFMVRRTRSYQFEIDNKTTVLNKHNYRKHDLESSVIKEITPLQKLTLALVQKNLVKILSGNNNKFKMGYLSSFESMSSSINNSNNTDPENDDYYNGKNESKQDSQQKLDDQFIEKLSESYFSDFSEKLPHPKVDDIVKKVWDNYKKGEKSLVFTRRISSTHEIENRLNKKWEEEIENRIRKVYGIQNLWDDIKIKPNEEESIDDENENDKENSNQLDEVVGADKYLAAVKKGQTYKDSGNIYKFIVTFNESKSNDLIFEENYLTTLKKIGIVNDEMIDTFVNKNGNELIDIYKSSYDSSGKKINNYQLYFRILDLFFEKQPDDSTNKDFNLFKEFVKKNKINKKTELIIKDIREEVAIKNIRELIDRVSFWEILDGKNSIINKSLYANDLDNWFNNFEYREIVKEIISSQIRLTDLAIDLYYANGKKYKINKESLVVFVDNLFSESEKNKEFYGNFINVFKLWVQEQGAVEKYFINKESIQKEKGEEGELTIKNIIQNLTRQQVIGNYQFTVGVSGRNRVSDNLIRKFNSPGYPFAIITTDILKEGMDLHVFCKNIYHYGIAWTPGDMEQRNGRLDRNFSLFERELYKSNNKLETKLNIYYPFISKTVEQHQIQKVIESIIDSAKVLDDIEEKDSKINDESKVIDTNSMELIKIEKLQQRLISFSKYTEENKNGEFEPSFDGITSIKFVEQKINFKDKIIELKEKLANHNPDWKSKSANDNISFDFWKDKVSMQLIFVREISQYVIQFTKEKDNLQEVLKYSMDQFQKDDKIYYGLRIYLDNDFDSDKIVNLIDFAQNAIENPNSLDKQNLNLAGQNKSILDKNDKFSYILGENSPEHALHFNVELNDERSQKVKIYCYDNMLLISSKVAKIDLIKNNNTNEQKMTVEQAQEWVLRKNNHIDFGYFNYHNDYIRLSERYIIDTKNISTDENKLIDFIITLARFADIHEYYLTGENEN